MRPAWILALILTAQLAQARPSFEELPCASGVEASRCGFVTVPENRSRPGRTIRLYVAVVEASREKTIADPVFFLDGGPGGHAVRYAAGIAAVAPMADFVVFDQRGIGLSQPALECPELDGLPARDTWLITAEGAARMKDALLACGRRLRAQGIDLAAYNASESAQDVEDIRRALGYGPVNLYGVSYGTRLAQEVMRRFPGSLRAVVLDGVIPPGADSAADESQMADEALGVLFARCAADRDCRAAYPALREEYLEVVRRLGEQPARIEAGGKQAVAINGAGFQLLVFTAMYSAANVSRLPQLIRAFAQGDLRAVANSRVWESVQSGTDMTWAAYFTHECRGEVAFADREQLRLRGEPHPAWRHFFELTLGLSSPRTAELCRAWGLEEPSALENTPVHSDVPTLLLGGGFDPVTPPRLHEAVARGLSRAHNVVIADGSHGVSFSACGHLVVRQFLLQPAAKPSPRCLETPFPTFMFRLP